MTICEWICGVADRSPMHYTSRICEHPVLTSTILLRNQTRPLILIANRSRITGHRYFFMNATLSALLTLTSKATTTPFLFRLNSYKSSSSTRKPS